MFFPATAAQWHAALNDFPSILFLVALGFDLAGEATKRDSLRTAGFWTLVVGAVGAIAAVVSGLVAERTVEHGGSMHLLMERHETLGIALTVLFVGLAAWRIWRKGRLGPKERPTYLSVSTVGVLGILWTAHLGGTIVYEYGGGIPTRALEDVLRDRAAGHVHEGGAAHEHGPGETPDHAPTDTAGQAAGADHEHPLGTPEHRHD